MLKKNLETGKHLTIFFYSPNTDFHNPTKFFKILSKSTSKKLWMAYTLPGHLNRSGQPDNEDGEPNIGDEIYKVAEAWWQEQQEDRNMERR